ncbi:MAG: cobalamin-independent methionine synthase II family protein [Pirellulaceae bacterium]
MKLEKGEANYVFPGWLAQEKSQPMYKQTIPNSPRILTTTVGSYPIPDWLAALPSEQAVLDATRVIFDTQRQAGIDLPTDGELYRFDVNHPDTNGMIEYFTGKFSGAASAIGRANALKYQRQTEMAFRAKPAAVVHGELGAGSLNLYDDCARAASVAGGPLKFTLTSPYMLARTLLDNHYHDFPALTLAIADILAEQVRGLPCACVQVDEANIPGNPEDGPLAATAINRILDAVDDGVQTAVHFCFGNYGGQTIQNGGWRKLTNFLNQLQCDHLVLELAHRPDVDLQALKEVDARIAIGLGVVDIKVNHIETADEIAARIDKAARVLGDDRIRWIHPDCGFWMLKRSIADRKIAALVAGRNKYIGC